MEPMDCPNTPEEALGLAREQFRKAMLVDEATKPVLQIDSATLLPDGTFSLKLAVLDLERGEADTYAINQIAGQPWSYVDHRDEGANTFQAAATSETFEWRDLGDLQGLLEKVRSCLSGSKALPEADLEGASEEPEETPVVDELMLVAAELPDVEELEDEEDELGLCD